MNCKSSFEMHTHFHNLFRCTCVSYIYQSLIYIHQGKGARINNKIKQEEEEEEEEIKLVFSLFTNYTTSTAVQCILGSLSSRSTVNKDAFCFGFGIEIGIL